MSNIPDYKKIQMLSEQKGWAIATHYVEQYALGVTGTNQRYVLIVNNGQPFKTKKEAMEFAKDNNIKNYNKKGQPNEGYGSLGAQSFTVNFVRTKDLARGEKWDHLCHLKENLASKRLTLVC